MLQKIFAVALMLVLLVSFSFGAVAAENITLVINGETVNSDVNPLIINSRTMVPARAVFEKFGAHVSWDDILRRVTITAKDNIVVLTVDSNVGLVNGSSVYMDVAPTIVNGRTLVPVRFISENLGYSVDWNGVSRIVYISGTVHGTTNQKPNVESGSKVENVDTPPANNVAKAVLHSVSVDEVNDGVTVNVTLSGKVEPSVMTLDTPYRIVFDFYGVSQACKNGSVNVSGSFVSQVRWGGHDEYTRVVVECISPQKYALSYADNKCVITIGHSGNVNSNSSQVQHNASVESTMTQVKNPVVNGAAPLVCIDPGHGGYDYGAIGRDADGNTVVNEKDANLSISLKVRDLLVNAGIQVLMTRDTDVSLGETQMEDLVTRATIANNADTLLYISIHNNAFTDPSATGTTVLYASTDDSETYGVSGKKLADNIQTYLVKATGLRDRGTVHSPEMVVLKRTVMPAVIVECAFVSCSVDQQVLTNENKINDIAIAIYNGIIDTLKIMGKVS